MIFQLFFFLFTAFSILAIDTTTVRSDFDENGLPVFRSPQHELNWFLDRTKPKRITITNHSQKELDIKLVVKQIYGSWPHLDIPQLIEAFPDFLLCFPTEQTDHGSLVFSSEKFPKVRVNELDKKKTLFFQELTKSLNAGETFEFTAPYGFVRSLDISSPLDFNFDNEHFDVSLLTSYPSKKNHERLSKLIMSEFVEKDQEFYEGFENLWAPNARFVGEFYKQAGLELSAVSQKRKRIVDSSKSITLAHLAKTYQCPQTPKIPFLIHKIWITDIDAPREVPLQRLQHYISEARKYPGFKHMFWCNEKSRIPDTIKYLESAGLALEVREIKEIWPEFRGKDIFNRYYQNKRFVATTDVARFNIVWLYGGIYSDFGIEFNVSPLWLCNTYDCITTREQWLVGTTLIGSKKNNPFLGKLLEHLDNIDCVPHETRRIADGIHVVPWTALNILTCMFDIYSTENMNYLHIPWNQGIISVNATASWLKQGTGQNSVLTHKLTDNEYFGEDLVSETSYKLVEGRWDSNITHQMSKILFAKNLSYISEKRRRLSETSRSTYYQLFPQRINLIPHITHRCWLTNPSNPFESPKDKLDHYINSLRTLNVDQSWQHYFWCLDPTKIPQTIEYLQRANVGIQIKALSEIYPHMRAKHVFDALIKDGRYTNANDVSRMEIMSIFGGLYCDIGVELNRNVTNLIDRYNYFFFLDEESHSIWSGHLDHSLIASAPRSEVVEAYLNNLKQLHTLPAQAKAITPACHEHIYWTGCNFLMSYIDSCLPPTTRILFVWDGSIVKMHRMNSWGPKPQFGNKSILETRVNLFEVQPPAQL